MSRRPITPAEERAARALLERAIRADRPAHRRGSFVLNCVSVPAALIAAIVAFSINAQRVADKSAHAQELVNAQEQFKDDLRAHLAGAGEKFLARFDDKDYARAYDRLYYLSSTDTATPAVVQELLDVARTAMEQAARQMGPPTSTQSSPGNGAIDPEMKALLEEARDLLCGLRGNFDVLPRLLLAQQLLKVATMSPASPMYLKVVPPTDCAWPGFGSPMTMASDACARAQATLDEYCNNGATDELRCLAWQTRELVDALCAAYAR